MESMSRSTRIIGGCNDDHEVDVIPDIYFEVNGESGGRTWHIIKLLSEAKGSVSMKLLKDSKIPEFPDGAAGGAAAVIGSKIYVSGGFYRRGFRPYATPISNKVYYVDAHDPHPQWQQAPPMISVRGDHYKFAYNGKLYALSGCTGGDSIDKYGKKLFAEVYDPNSTQGWKELARISSDAIHFKYIYGHAVVLHGSDTKILFHAFRSNYIHGILMGSPDVFDTDYLLPHTAFASAFVDGVFYYLDYSRDIEELYAFNINEPLGGHKRVKFVNKKRKGCLPYHCQNDLWGTVPTYPTTHLLSLGNRNLAVIWARECYLRPSLRVYCSILEVSKKEDNCFEAKVLGYSNYIMKQGSLGYCVPMRPWREDVGKNTESSNKKQQSEKKRTRGEGTKRGSEEKRKSGIIDAEKSATVGGKRWRDQILESPHSL